VRRKRPIARPWFASPIGRLRFLDELQSSGLTAREIDRPIRFEDGVTYEVLPHLRILPKRRLRIVFTASSPNAVRVWATGPGCAAHRNPDGSLCLWYPKDSERRRWTHGSGGKKLLGIVIRHLHWEADYNRTGVWPGLEAPHGYSSPGLDENDDVII
jgi:hypothetical protein